MQKIVYIIGLGHSGSTVFDMSLGCHPKIVGLGEVWNILKAGHKELESPEFNKILCSCGQNMYRCDFWSGVRDWLLLNSDKDINFKYQFLLRHFLAKYGKDVILIDSSKIRNDYLTFLDERFCLYVIFLVRDYRSWIYSRYSRHRTNMFRLAWQWLKGNALTKTFLTHNKMKFIKVGYEELALYPEIILKKTCEFVELPFDKQMLEPNRTRSHIIRGNVARGDKEKRRRLLYDARWLTSTKLSLFGPLLFPLMKWNRKNVYSNIIIGKTRAFGVPQSDFVLFGNKRKEDLVFKLEEFEEEYSKDKTFQNEVGKSLEDKEGSLS